jgi:hypothetical protein
MLHPIIAFTSGVTVVLSTALIWARRVFIGHPMQILERGDDDEASDLSLALAVGEALNKQYPNHPWLVGFQGRALVIRHLGIASEVARVLGREGFASLLPREKLGTHQEVVATAMRYGGELLEAFGLKRGEWDGTPPIVPKAWRFKQDKHFQ